MCVLYLTMSLAYNLMWTLEALRMSPCHGRLLFGVRSAGKPQVPPWKDRGATTERKKSPFTKQPRRVMATGRGGQSSMMLNGAF